MRQSVAREHAQCRDVSVIFQHRLLLSFLFFSKNQRFGEVLDGHAGELLVDARSGGAKLGHLRLQVLDLYGQYLNLSITSW